MTPRQAIKQAQALVRGHVPEGHSLVDELIAERRIGSKLRLLTREAGLSLGDRACLATALVLNRVALIADQAWMRLNLGITVQCIR